MACLNTGSICVALPANFLGRKKGVSAPYFFATLAISGLSVETMVRFIRGLFRAVSIAQAINGLPQKFLMFFPGTPFEPPRAGTMATMFRFFLAFITAFPLSFMIWSKNMAIKLCIYFYKSQPAKAGIK